MNDVYELTLWAKTILQPPRDVQLSAGIVLAVLAISVTFLVLGVLTISIKLMSMGVLRFTKRREVAAPTAVEVKPPVEVKAAPEVSEAEIAAAVVAVHKYVLERLAPAITSSLKPTSYWILSWRRDACINLNDYDYVLKSSKLRRFKKYLI